MNIVAKGIGAHFKTKIFPSLKNVGANVPFIISKNKENLSFANDNGIQMVESLEDIDPIDNSLLYISTPISKHYEDCVKAFNNGLHVICEKPLTESSKLSKELFKLAESKNLLLFEVCMYQYHPQFHMLQEIYKRNKHAKIPQKISLSFTIPHLPPDNFRYKKELGGGAILDVGYYPISCVTALEDSLMIADKNIIFENDLPQFGKIRYFCKEKLSEFIVKFGIGYEYSNFCKLEFNDEIIEFDRFFSKPLEFDSKTIFKKNNTSSLQIHNVNQFEIMFDHYLNILKSESKDEYHNLKNKTLQISENLGF